MAATDNHCPCNMANPTMAVVAYFPMKDQFSVMFDSVILLTYIFTLITNSSSFHIRPAYTFSSTQGKESRLGCGVAGGEGVGGERLGGFDFVSA